MGKRVGKGRKAIFGGASEEEPLEFGANGVTLADESAEPEPVDPTGTADADDIPPLAAVLKDVHRDYESIHGELQQTIWKEEQVRVIKQLWKGDYAANMVKIKDLIAQEAVDADTGIFSALTLQYLLGYTA